MTEKPTGLLPLPAKLKTLLLKSKDILLYLFVGFLTTLLNGAVYWICIHCGAVNIPSTIIAWVIAVLFAFFANKLIVFASKDMTLRRVLTEMGQFIGCRLGTGFIDVGIMYVSVDCLGWNGLLMKLVSDFIVTLINFAASKFYIFRKK